MTASASMHSSSARDRARHGTRPAAALAAAALLAATALQAAEPVRAPDAATAVATDPCNGAPRCFSAGTFVAEVMQVSVSAMTPGARNQTVSLNIRFRNVSDKPVILAYRAGSSSAL